MQRILGRMHRMDLSLSGVVVASIVAFAFASGCGDDEVVVATRDSGTSETGTGGSDGSTDGATFDSPIGDSGTETDGADSGEAGDTSGVGYFRVVHLVEGSPPAIDFCVSARNDPTNFASSTPVLKDTLASGIAQYQATRYYPIPVGSLAIRIVAATADDCSSPLYADLPLTGVDVRYTSIVLSGVANSPTKTAFVDNAPSSAFADGGTGASIRAIHLAGGANLDVGTSSLTNGNFAPMFDNIPFGQAAPAGGLVDARGYYFPALLDATIVSVHATGSTTTDLVVWPSVTLDIGSVATLFLLPPVNTGPVRGFLCVRDYAAFPNAVVNTTCSFLQP